MLHEEYRECVGESHVSSILRLQPVPEQEIKEKLYFSGVYSKFRRQHVYKAEIPTCCLYKFGKKLSQGRGLGSIGIIWLYPGPVQDIYFHSLNFFTVLEYHRIFTMFFYYILSF